MPNNNFDDRYAHLVLLLFEEAIMNSKKKKKTWYLTEAAVAFIIEITLQNERTKTIAKSTSLYIIKLFW